MAHDQARKQERGQRILKVFDDTFGELLKGDAAAIRIKYRKMAGSAFAFFRGSACLFYTDMEKEQQSSPFINEETGRIWIHGDLHAENFGTYMSSQGNLIFNVNDFDEAYVGPFLWDLQRFVASIALIGYGKALSDDQITSLVKAYATSYMKKIQEVVQAEENMQHVKRFTLDTAKGPLLKALQSARAKTRADLLDGMTEVEDSERHFAIKGGAEKLDEETAGKVLEAFKGYLKTLPESNPNHHRPDSISIKDVVSRRGVGIGSAGLPSFNVLLEGTTEALENDVVIFLKQAQEASVAGHIPNASTAKSHFKHEGHRTVVSERALQSYSDPWLGWTEIDGKGFLVAEVSPYAVDLDWSEINGLAEMKSVVADLGAATAMMHAAGDDDREHSDVVPFSPEKAIHKVLKADGEGFIGLMVEFSHEYSTRVREDHAIFVDLFRNAKIPGLMSEEDDE